MSRAAAILVVLIVTNAALAARESDRLSSPLPGGYPPLISANYAGYVNIPSSGRRSFYWFVQSERSPTTDPLVLWLNGGPGCSSLLGLHTEIGPYILRNGGVWQRNPYTFVKQTNVLFLESPAGVGFSIDHSPATNWTDLETAQLNYEFLQQWLNAFPEYAGRNFYIAGESYAGHYIPQLADQIVSGPNTTLRNMFKGFMAGNPCTGAPDGSNNDWCFVDVDTTLTDFYKYHGLQSLSPAIGFANNSAGMFDPYDFLVRTCGDNLDGLMAARLAKHSKGTKKAPASAVLNMNNVRTLYHGDGGGEYGPCAEQHLTNWFRQPEVIAAIHAVGPAAGWGSCANIVYPTPENTPGVLPLYRKFMDTTTLNMMVYSGTADTVVNFIQTQSILNSLQRPIVENFTAWFYQDVYNYTWKQLGGYYTRWDRISWVGVRGAGHMVPTYQPAAAFQMYSSFLALGHPGMTAPATPYTTEAPLATPPSAPSGDSDDAKKEIALVFAGLCAGIVVSLIVMGVANLVRRRRNREATVSQERVMSEAVMMT
jgi:serine carboxypeptidase-like clade 2